MFAALPVFLQGRRVGKHAVDAHRIGNVLDLAVTERLVSANQLMLYLFVNAAGDIDLTRVGNAFESRSNIDAVAINVVCFDDDVAKIDANSILDPVVLGQRCVAANQILLDDDAAPDGFDGTVENCDEAVACGLNKLAVVFFDAGFDEVTLDPLDAIMRAFLVDLHQPAVAEDIACYDRGKTAGRRFARWLTNSA